MEEKTVKKTKTKRAKKERIIFPLVFNKIDLTKNTKPLSLYLLTDHQVCSY
jgi:hypothetical protein